MKNKKLVPILLVILASIGMYQLCTHSLPSSCKELSKTMVVVNAKPVSIDLIQATNPFPDVENQNSDTTPINTLKGAKTMPQSEQESLWTAFDKARREVCPLTNHQKTIQGNERVLFLASNPSQHINACFLDNGLRLLSNHPGRNWQASVSLVNAGEVREVRHQGTQIEYVRDDLLEWYHNRPEGLEHGYIVERKTDALTLTDDGRLSISIQIAGLSVRSLGEADLQFVNINGDPILSYSKLQVWDANGTPLEASMKPTGNGLNILVADAGAAYPIMIDPLIASLELQYTASSSAELGTSVSLSGDMALIGASRDSGGSTRSGSAYVFVRSGSSWSQQGKGSVP